MNTLRFPLVAFLLFSTLCPEANSEEEGVSSGRVEGERDATVRETAFDLDIEGATIPEVADYLRSLPELRVDGVPINLVVAPNVEGLVLPPMRLRNVKLGQFAAFLQEFSGGAIQLFETEGIWMFRDPSRSASFKTSSSTSVFALGEQPDEILSLIEEVLAEGVGAKPMLKFHEPTGTLIVNGGDHHHRLVGEIVATAEAGRRSAQGRASAK